MKPFSIRDLRFLHDRNSKYRATVFLLAYFDETGIHQDAPVTAICGYVGSETAWEQVEKEWRPALAEFADFGVKSFHMVECINQSGQFGRLDKPKINRLITVLADILGKADIQPIASAVVVDDWQHVTDQQFLAQFHKPFMLCFDDVVRQICEWSARYANSERVAPMFAYQSEFCNRMTEIGLAYGSQDWYRRILSPTISFGYPSEIVQLQGADLLAHQWGWHIEKLRRGQVNLADSGITECLQLATGGRFVHGHWHDAAGLELLVKSFRETGEIYRVEV